MAKKIAAEDGVYTLGPGRYRVAAGQELPDGAEFVAKSDLTSQKAAKKTKKPAEAGAPVKPSANAQGSGPSETS